MSDLKFSVMLVVLSIILLFESILFQNHLITILLAIFYLVLSLFAFMTEMRKGVVRR